MKTGLKINVESVYKRLFHALGGRRLRPVDGAKAFYAGLINPGDLCFDIGAHVGYRTDMFLKLGANVVCVEPQPKCIRVLAGKYRSNSKVVLVPKGLAAKTGTMSLSICEAADTISTFSAEWKAGRFRQYRWDYNVEVPVTTLDNLIREYGVPQFCKIDVEGFECEVLKGLSRAIRMISFEFTREFFRNAQWCVNYLETFGECEFNYSQGESMEFAMQDWVNGVTLCENIVHTPDDLLWGDIYGRFRS
jgi:FkbM family methyltransferase